jgi:lipopolysaccharide export system permease protein
MPRIRIIDKYIFRELVTPFFLAVATLTLVFFIQRMFRLAELVVSKGATVLDTVQLFLFILPGFLIITIPMATLIAALTAFARLSSDSELTAMKASRISLYDMLRPVAVFSAATLVASALLSIVILPDANRALKAHLFNMVKSKAMVGIEPGVFSSTFDGIVIYVERMKSIEAMEGLIIADERSSDAPSVITARRGTLIADPRSFTVTLAMEQGSIHTPPRSEDSYTLTTFDRGRLSLDINHALLSRGPGGRIVKETTTPALIAAIAEQRAAGARTIEYENELHTRLSVPVACLIFGIIGAPLGIRRSRSGRSAGIVVAMGVFLVYYSLIGAGKSLAEAGAISVAAAYWIPNGIMAAATGVLIGLRGHEITLGVGDGIATVFRRLRKKPVFID